MVFYTSKIWICVFAQEIDVLKPKSRFFNLLFFWVDIFNSYGKNLTIDGLNTIFHIGVANSNVAAITSQKCQHIRTLKFFLTSDLPSWICLLFRLTSFQQFLERLFYQYSNKRSLLAPKGTLKNPITFELNLPFVWVNGVVRVKGSTRNVLGQASKNVLNVN